jgi:protein-disulfide isomerase
MRRLPFRPMPSGKKARQQRREAVAAATRTPPPVRSKGGGGVRGPRQASPRTLAISGGVVLVVVIAIVLAIVLGSSGGGSSSGGNVLKGLPATGSATWAGALDGAPQANDLFKGIPQQGLVLGSPSAPVEMEMFIDVQCPICQNFEVNYLPGIVQKYIRKGKVQLHLQPWAFLGGAGSQSFSGRLGLIAASFQNKGFQYAKVLYDNQGTENTGWLTDQMMANIGASVTGLKMSQWWSDTNSSGPEEIAKKVDRLATKDKVSGTPSIFVGKVGGSLSNVQTPQEIANLLAPTLQETEQALDAAIANS